MCRRRRLVIILRMTLLGVEHDDRGRRRRFLFVLHGLAAVVVVLSEPPVVHLVVEPVERARPEVQRVRRFARLDGRVTEVAERAEYGGRRLCEHFDLVRLVRVHRLRPVGRGVPDGRRDVHDARQVVVRGAESGRPLVDTRYRYPVVFWIARENLKIKRIIKNTNRRDGRISIYLGRIRNFMNTFDFKNFF